MQPTSVPPAFTSRSRETGTDYAIYIDSPDKKERGPWIVALLTDGDGLFAPAIEAIRPLRASRNFPPVLLVGLGYGAWFGKPGNHRVRDYTPTAFPGEPASGGADRFLAYLEGTLWPELGRRHPLREDARLLAGHSLGSLLVLHALFQPRPFFNRALASAPSIWWNERSVLGDVARLRDRQATLPARLYLGVGADDTPSMTDDLELLEKALVERPFSGLEVTSRKFPGRDHYNVVVDSLRAGFEILLAGQAGN